MNSSTPGKPSASTPRSDATTRFVLIGGFLGAGKTTALACLGRRLESKGIPVACITNDHGSEIVDTRFLRSKGLSTEQIIGGCLSAEFDALAEQATRLCRSADSNLILAEPVGTCADLAAKVIRPLRELNHCTVAPLSVLVDPVRALKNEKGGGFSEKVQYIYRKQIEEADIVVINKIDSVSVEAVARLQERFTREFPHARILPVSLRRGEGVDQWLDAIFNHHAGDRAVSIDCQIYNEAESLLSWLNCDVQISALKGFSCNPIMREIALAIRRDLCASRIEIGHLKMTITPEYEVGGFAMLHLSGSDLEPETNDELPEPIERGVLSMNLRAEGKPDALHSAVSNALTHIGEAFPGLFVRLTNMEHFRPTVTEPKRRRTAQGCG